LWECGIYYFQSDLLERFSYLCKLFLARGFLIIAKIQGAYFKKHNETEDCLRAKKISLTAD